jgi:hypothetical protein
MIMHQSKPIIPIFVRGVARVINVQSTTMFSDVFDDFSDDTGTYKACPSPRSPSGEKLGSYSLQNEPGRGELLSFQGVNQVLAEFFRPLRRMRPLGDSSTGTGTM